MAANSDPLFAKLAVLMGEPELIADPRYTGNAARVKNAAALDDRITAWTGRFTAEILAAMLDAADIPVRKCSPRPTAPATISIAFAT